MKVSHSTIRSFVAIELSDEARAELSRLQNRLKAILPRQTVRWTVPRNIHLTLHFLGDLSVNHLETVSRTIGNVAARIPAFSLILSNLGCFPNTRRPRILWVGLSGETELLGSLQQELGEQLKKSIGFEPESRKYSPHLTIARIKKGVTQKCLRDLGRLLEHEIPRVGQLAILPVNRIHFIQSDLEPNGPVYTSLAQTQLGQDPGRPEQHTRNASNEPFNGTE